MKQALIALVIFFSATATSSFAQQSATATPSVFDKRMERLIASSDESVLTILKRQSSMNGFVLAIDDEAKKKDPGLKRHFYGIIPAGTLRERVGALLLWGGLYPLYEDNMVRVFANPKDLAKAIAEMSAQPRAEIPSSVSQQATTRPTPPAAEQTQTATRNPNEQRMEQPNLHYSDYGVTGTNLDLLNVGLMTSNPIAYEEVRERFAFNVPINTLGGPGNYFGGGFPIWSVYYENARRRMENRWHTTSIKPEGRKDDSGAKADENFMEDLELMVILPDVGGEAMPFYLAGPATGNSWNDTDIDCPIDDHGRAILVLKQKSTGKAILHPIWAQPRAEKRKATPWPFLPTDFTQAKTIKEILALYEIDPAAIGQ